jgi:DNA polymerase-1
MATKKTEQDTNPILLIDGENILHQSFHKFENFRAENGKKSGAIYGFFRFVGGMIVRFHPKDVYITFDNGHSPIRDGILKDYKGHRKNISVDYESLQEQKAVIIKMLGILRVKYIFDKRKTTQWEGDDFLAYLTMNLKSKGKIMIVSSDKDFNQLLDKKVKIYNPRKEDIITHDTCKIKFGYEAKETADYLSLVGDKSDDIPGYPGIGEKKARQFLDKYGSIENALQSDFPDKEKLGEIHKRNRLLIDLTYFIDNYPMKPGTLFTSWEDLPMKVYPSHTHIHGNRLKKICIDYSLHSFMTTRFINPFIKLLKSNETC